ncbi:cbb3-type cytochrome c oxidase subunit 3 [Inmirania thermothiophila]|uniref:Cytochrome c oxidase cbb3-type subunit 4 n=1 Tax=Inmirania thermothiophila TaxID=1750597 RepID=A0A3N1Y6S9_9GAMM|nr:cbb3-type cytochrome c oxidase subunit 3 [Inmirania thermothiophila]ROR34460.1 cytochrome c oxidase cbb3-type subunit 4 [Inmirania thermothiophila]
MSSLREYFHTDWAAMTWVDWIGLSVTVGTFLLMLGLYVYVFRPRNRERLERHRHIPLDDE